MHFTAMAASPAIRVTQHVLLAVGGGYLLAAGVSALLARLLVLLMAPSEAVMLMSMLAFILYLIIVLWAFAERRLWRLWLVVGGGGAVAFATARILAATGGGS